MDVILVVNAGSSSLKFQSFGLVDGGLQRRVRGQVDGIGVRPRLRIVDAAGVVLIDRSHEAAEIPDLPAAIGVLRDWLKTRKGITLRAIGHRVVHGGPDFDRAVLIEAARDCGMDPKIVADLLAGDADKESVREEIASAQHIGVTGVPFFILDGKFALPGAQPADVLKRAIGKALEKADEPRA